MLPKGSDHRACDAPLMANLITLQVIGAVLTLPLVIWLAQSV
ncbi:MAG: hypothetical protein WBN81_05550 [Gammaproteobacteria bacterium]